MALRIRLKANERVVIGGAVVRNGRHAASLLVENCVPILRGSEILGPRDVRTPCQRIVLALQLLYLEPGRAATHRETFRGLAREVREAAPSTRPLLEDVERHVKQGNYYRALRATRPLLHHERMLLDHVR
jgi:flagellar protein FlbT